MGQAVEQWHAFTSLQFAKGVSLADRVALFMVSVDNGLRRWPELRNAPGSPLLLIAEQAVVRSGTHTREHVEVELAIAIGNA